MEDKLRENEKQKLNAKVYNLLPRKKGHTLNHGL